MGYDNDFYRAYEAYLTEPDVVRVHSEMVSVIGAPKTLLDIGCGQSREILRRMTFPPEVYVGVDMNVEAGPAGSGLMHRLIKGNYRDPECMKVILSATWGIDTFVSLFSTEITAPTKDNYFNIYDRLFARGFKTGLVSGFYYASKRDQNPIGETGGLTSWQTLEQPEDIHSTLYTETRIITHVPSKMFGPDVYEVWKLFKAR